MSRYGAASDLDYREEANPSVPTVERTCVCCGGEFTMEVEGAYVLRAWCPRCQADAVADARQKEGAA